MNLFEVGIAVPDGKQRALGDAAVIAADMLIAVYANDAEEGARLQSMLTDDDDTLGQFIGLTLACMKIVGLAPSTLRALAKDMYDYADQSDRKNNGKGNVNGT